MLKFEVMIMARQYLLFDILNYTAVEKRSRHQKRKRKDEVRLRDSPYFHLLPMTFGLQKMSKVRHLFIVLAPLGATNAMDVVYSIDQLGSEKIVSCN